MTKKSYYAITMSVGAQGVCPKDFLYQDYNSFFRRFGIHLIYLPNDKILDGKIFDEIPVEGIILSGGNDLTKDITRVDIDNLKNPSELRDNFEKQVLDLAVSKNMAVLGICRGMQIINSYFGGFLTHNFEEAQKPHVARNHRIKICDKQAIEDFKLNEVEVNSFHHHVVESKFLANDLKVIATSIEDAVVEALYHEKLPIVGVQWHPERANSSSELDSKLINAFISRDFYWKVR